MEPNAENLAKELDKISAEQEKLRGKVLSIQENELLQLRRQVDALDSYVSLITKIGPMVVVAATLVLTVLGWQGYSTWKTGLKEDIKKQALNEIKPIITRHKTDLDNTVNEFKNGWEKELNHKLDLATYLNADIEEMVKMSLNKDDQKVHTGLARLQQCASDYLEREYLFATYIELCIKKGRFIKAYDHVMLAENNKIFPDGYKIPSTFILSGLTLWIKSLLKDRDAPESRYLVTTAQEYLRRAEKAARQDKFHRDVRQDTRRDVVYYSFFIYLSEDSPREAREFLNEYFGFGEEMDWSLVKNSEWFRLLLEKRPHVRGHLATLCPSAFATSKVKLGYW